MKDELIGVAAGSFDWQWVVIVFFGGLGLSTSGYDPISVLGGFCLAGTSAMVAWKLGGEKDRRRYWVVIMTGLAVAYLAALLHPWLTEKFGIAAPMQASMFVAGFTSKWLASFAFDFFERLGSKGKILADRVVPEDEE